MRRLASSSRGLSIATICQPSASRSYATRGNNEGTRSTTSKIKDGSLDADLDNLSGFNYGFDNWSEINKSRKTIKTAAGSLPISPLLDPAWREARQRKKKKIPQKEAKHNRFQRRMMENPFAQLLAEPVRYCSITRARLPRPFMQSFGLVKHPETQDMWWIPADFASTEDTSVSETPDKSESSADDGHLAPSDSVPVKEPQEHAANQSPPELDQGSTKSGSQPSLDQAISGPQISTSKGDEATIEKSAAPVPPQQSPAPAKKGKFYAPVNILARQDLMLEFFDKKSKFTAGYMRFAANPNIGKLSKNAIWRQDMHEVIRDQARRQIADELVYLWQLCEKKDRDYLKAISDLGEFQSDWNRFCCLFLGEGALEPFEALHVPNTAAKTVPGYDLPTLLGSEVLEKLRSEATIFRDAVVVVLRGKRTLGVNKKLWLLQGFVADYQKLL